MLKNGPTLENLTIISTPHFILPDENGDSNKEFKKDDKCVFWAIKG